jgi:hypothetical protein
MVLAMLVMVSTALAGSSVLPYAGVVSVDSAAAKSGEAVTLAVRLVGNNISITAALLPINYDPTVLTLDSVSFDPTFKPDGIQGLYFNDVANKLIRIVYIPSFNKTPMDTISASSGVLAYLHFRVAASATSQFTPIDSLNFDSIMLATPTDTVHLTVRVEFANNTGTGVYLPGFVPGGVAVLVPTDVNESNLTALPADYGLGQNYPNPFNPTTSIGFDLPKAGQVRLEVFNLLGQSVKVLAEGRYTAGSHQVMFSADNLPSGIYFYRLSHDGGAATRKMILLK